MRSVSSLRLIAFAIPFALAPIVLAASQVPSWIGLDERACYGVSADEELDDRYDVYEDYYDASLDDLRNYRHNVRTAWLIADDAQRKTFLKQIDREHATQVKYRQTTLSDRLASLKETKADTDAFCKQRTADAKKFIADKCLSNAECTGGKVCSVQLGACDQSCPIGSLYCVPSCAGTCVKP